MIEASDTSQSDNLPALDRFDLTSKRRIARERHVRAVLIAKFRVLANASEQLALADHDEVIGQLAAERA